MPPDDSNPYFGVIQQLQDQDATTTVMQQSNRNPADVARAARLARYTAAPAALIENQPSSYELQVRRQNTEAALRADPELSTWLRDANHAAVSQNDVMPLSIVGGVLQPWTRAQQEAAYAWHPGQPANPLATVSRIAMASILNRPEQSPLAQQPSGLPGNMPMSNLVARVHARQAADAAAYQAENERQANEGFVPRFGRVFGGMIAGGVLQAVQGAEGVAQASLENPLSIIPGAGVLLDHLGLSDPTGIGAATSAEFIRARGQTDAAMTAITPRNLNDLGAGLFSGGQSIVALGLAARMGGVEGVLPLLAGMSGGQAYGQYRAGGANPQTALVGAEANAAIEYVTERIPVGWLTNRFGKQGASGFLSHFVVGELLGEQVATHSQDLIDAMEPGGGGWQNYLDTRGSAALQTLYAVGAMAGTIGGAHGIMQRLHPEAQTLDEVSTALGGQHVLDQMMTAAEGSQVRKLDPATFSQFVQQRAEGSQVQNVYLPVEAVNAYLQTEGADHEFFAPYAQQIADAQRLNGDVVIPVGEAMAHLAGTQAWEALRQDARLTPGGMSGREAHAAAATFMQTLETRGKEIAQEATDTSAALAPVTAIYERTKQELTALGQSPQLAEAGAQIFAARRETAAARLGMTVEAYDTAHPVQFRNAKKGEAPSEFALQQSDQLQISTDPESNQVMQWHVLRLGGAHPVTAGLTVHRGAGIIDISADAVNKLGPAALRTLAKEIANRIPEVKTLSGTRVTGAKAAARAQGSANKVDSATVNIEKLRQYFQEEKKKAATGKTTARGQTQFFPNGQSVITLFKTANFSTVVHEFGHLFLEEMVADAATDATPQELKDDVGRLAQWFKDNGHPIEGGVIPVGAHELFARGFERYAMEGKAPSVELRGAFAKFAQWLTKIYEKVKNLRAPITPEIREVMDRMLATDDAIAQNRVLPGFENQKQAGMTDAEWAAYQASIADAQNVAHDTLLEKVMETIRRRETQRGKDQRASIRDDVAKEVDALPEFVALHLLQTGHLPGDTEETPARKVKLNTGWLIDVFGEDILNQFPRGLPIIHGDGISGDIIAEQVGMDSGEHLVKALVGIRQIKDGLNATGDNRSVRSKMIDDRTDRIMAQRNGDILTEEQMREEAIGAVNSTRQGEILATELRQLSRRPTVKTGPTPYGIVRAWAKRIVQSGKVADTISRAAMQRYTRGAAKAQRAFTEALLADDHPEAFRQKEAQLLNHALLAEAKAAADAVDVAQRRLERIARRKTMASVDQAYLEQAQALLEQVELKARSQISIDKQDSWEAWASAQEKEGRELVVPTSFASSLGQTNWTRLSVEDLLSLDAAVKQVIELGRLKQTLRDAQGERAWNDGRDELAAAAASAGKQRKVTGRLDPTRSMWERVKSRIRLADAAMVKVEQLCDWLDSNDSNGPWNRYLFKPLADAQGKQGDRRKAYVEKLAGLIKALPKPEVRVWNRQIDVPALLNNLDPEMQGQPFRKFTHDQLVMVALNMGNEGNQQRLLDGYKWKEAQVWAALNQHMTEADWKFVQGVWDTVDELWPDVAELERRVNGFAPEKIEASEVTTPFGTQRGGYFPAVYDTTRSTAAALQEASTKAGGGAFFKSTTRADSTRERNAKVQRPILLDLSVITRHMNEVIHDITHREAVIQGNRLLTNDKIRRSIDRALGPEYIKAMEAWLEDVAHPNIAESRIDPLTTRLGRQLHKGITIQGLGYRVSTALIQPLGMANTVAQIGGVNTLAGQAIFAMHPIRTYKEVVGRSAEMRDRFANMDASITDMYNQRAKRGLQRFGPGFLEKHAFDGILWADLSITTGGWIGAFNKAVKEGMSESEATYYADKVIRTSQGAGGVKDRSGIMRNGAFIRSFYPFFSYANALYNQQRDVGRRARNIESAGDAVELARRAWWIMVVPPLLETLVRYAILGGQGPDEDREESWMAFLLRQIVLGNFNSLPLVGPLVNALGDGYSYRATSLQRVGEGVVAGARDFASATHIRDPDQHPVSKSWISNLFTTVGVFTGTPLGPLVGNPAQFAHDVNTGVAQPQGINDWWLGATTGRVAPPAQGGH